VGGCHCACHSTGEKAGWKETLSGSPMKTKLEAEGTPPSKAGDQLGLGPSETRSTMSWKKKKNNPPRGRGDKLTKS